MTKEERIKEVARQVMITQADARLAVDQMIYQKTKRSNRKAGSLWPGSASSPL